MGFETKKEKKRKKMSSGNSSSPEISSVVKNALDSVNDMNLIGDDILSYSYSRNKFELAGFDGNFSVSDMLLLSENDVFNLDKKKAKICLSNLIDFCNENLVNIKNKHERIDPVAKFEIAIQTELEFDKMAFVNFSEKINNSGKVLGNGLLLWLDAQLDTNAENLIISESLQHFVDTEITDAKHFLFENCGGVGTDIGVEQVRTGGSRETKNEKNIKDVIEAMKILKLCENKPIFVATKPQIMKCPILFSKSDVNSTNEILIDKLSKVENSLHSFIVKSEEQFRVLNKNVSKNDEILQKISTVSKSPNFSSESSAASVPFLSHSVNSILSNNKVLENPRSKSDISRLEDSVDRYAINNTDIPVNNIDIPVNNTDIPVNNTNIPVNDMCIMQPNSSSTSLYTSIKPFYSNVVSSMDYMNEGSDLQNSWTFVNKRHHYKPPSVLNQLKSHPPSVFNQLQKQNQNSEGFRQNSAWRSKLKTVHGNAKSISSENSLSSITPADINLVIFGLSKDTSSDNLVSYVNNHDIKLLKCEVLTKSENAHSLSYKVSIRSSDYDKIMNPEIWPYRVGVRHFKHFRYTQRLHVDQFGTYSNLNNGI